jgi:RNA polymerase sigma factor (sigma-70 family)
MLEKIPMLVEQPPYLVWRTDPKLARYLRSFIGDQAGNMNLSDRERVAQIIVQRSGQLPASQVDYTATDRLLTGCLTSLLAQIVFSPSGLGQIRFQVVKPLAQHSQSLEAIDVYAIGLEIISQPIKFLQGFKPSDVTWYSSLVGYSHLRFQRLLIDRLRSLPQMSGFKRTNLGLLVRSSPRRVKTALIESGEREPRLSGLLIIHQCLQEGVSANQFSTKNPETVHYEELLNRSREQCERVHLPIANCDTIIELLNYMGTVLRKYLQPPEISFDRPIGESGSTLGDFTPDARRSPVEVMASSEDQQQVQQLNQEVVKRLEELSLDCSLLLLWLYGLKMTQAEAGLELNVDQATVKRRRDRYLAKLAKSLYQITGSTEQLSIDTLAEIVQALMAVCENYYPASLMAILDRISLGQQDSAITNVMIEKLCQQFITEIQERWQFEFQPEQMGVKKATTFVRDNLKFSG